MHLTIDELLGYTDEERAKWQEWFAVQGKAGLHIALAGDAHKDVGAMILHIFWAELFYAYWMRDEVLTQESEIVQKYKDLPADQAVAIFDFGHFARQKLREFTDKADEQQWERVYEVEARGFHIRGPARKLIAHIQIHEIRHWAQIARMVRENGMAPPGDHDLLFSKSFGPVAWRV